LRWSSIHERSIQGVGRADGSTIGARGQHRGKLGEARDRRVRVGAPIRELGESDLIACADDEFLCSEVLTLWAMIRQARSLIEQA
jgi:hypothetical protein